ncbi:hypothetical protein [Enterococcus sp. AZ103]|uniref:hypothetical protein n=1 Tax=Enterococcus sp. AZ103 TaxID=2774628 RepID=UPI003F23CF4D
MKRKNIGCIYKFLILASLISITITFFLVNKKMLENDALLKLVPDLIGFFITLSVSYLGFSMITLQLEENDEKETKKFILQVRPFWRKANKLEDSIKFLTAKTSNSIITNIKIYNLFYYNKNSIDINILYKIMTNIYPSDNQDIYLNKLELTNQLFNNSNSKNLLLFPITIENRSYLTQDTNLELKDQHQNNIVRQYMDKTNQEIEVFTFILYNTESGEQMLTAVSEELTCLSFVIKNGIKKPYPKVQDIPDELSSNVDIFLKELDNIEKNYNILKSQ